MFVAEQGSHVDCLDSDRASLSTSSEDLDDFFLFRCMKLGLLSLVGLKVSS